MKTASDIFNELDNGKVTSGAPQKHPFASMAVDDVVAISSEQGRMQTYCHVYGRASGKKFKTRTDKSTGILYVKRVA